MYNDSKMKNETSWSFAVKVGHGYRQLLHDVKYICYRCLFSGRHKKLIQRACTHTHNNTLKPTTTFSTCLQKKQQQSCLLSPIYIELLLLSLMITSVMGIGNFSKHYKNAFYFFFKFLFCFFIFA